MQTGIASKTALRVAIRRAVHQVIDRPPILDDPIAVRLVGRGFARDMERAMHPVARDFRLLMAVRSRYAEDRLSAAVAKGTMQYVVLGAGLDTFAYRNPFPSLRVFEVDFPATQQWKRAMLAESAIPVPAGVTFVPLDMEHKTLMDGLADAGFNVAATAFFGCLGVVPYLTLGAFRATLADIAQLPAGTGVCFDYAFSPETLSPPRRVVFNALAARIAAAGEPFRLFFTTDEAEKELRRAGFQRIEQVDSEQLNEIYLQGRPDGLKLSPAGQGMLATAWV